MPRPTVSTTFNAIDKMAGPMRRMQANVKRFAVATGAAMAAATAITAKATIDFAKSGDEIAKTSRQIGVTAEALQELRFAADRSGVSSETFTSALQKMNKNVGDLRAGTGALTTLLNKTDGALMAQLKSAESNEEAFTLLVEAMAKIENPMERASLAQAAFGRAGQELIVMAENGAEGIEALREEARKYGNIISTDTAESSEKFVDAMTNMQAAMSGIRNKALAPLVEAFTPLIQQLADWVAAHQDLIDQKIQSFIQGIADAGRFLARNWENGLIPALLAGITAFMGVSKVIMGAQGLIAALRALNIVTATFGTTLMATPVGWIAAGIAAVAAVTYLAVKNFDKWGAVVLAAMGPFGALVTQLVIFKQHWDDIVTAFQDGGLIKGLWEIAKVMFEALIKPFQQLWDLTQKIGGFLTGKGNAGRVNPNTGRTRRDAEMISENRGVRENRETFDYRSTLDVNLNNLPPGTASRQRGSAPGINVNYGYRGATL
jgi:hypothetical protein